MKFDLKYFRESILKKTQEELAVLLEVRQDAVSRMERSPEQITLEMLLNISKSTGYSVEDLLSLKRTQIELLNINDNWSVLLQQRNNITSYLNQLNVPLASSSYNFEQIDEFNSLKANLQTLIKKPRIAFLGNSDVGKSSMINSLIGQDVLPAGWTPTTSLPVLIRHIDDKPDFIENNVIIFKNQDTPSSSIDYSRLEEKEYFERWLLESGSLEVLSTYGTRQGNEHSIDLAGSALLYVDSTILKSCELMDLPGFGTGDRSEDDNMAKTGKDTADIFIYLSIVNGFMRGTDINYLKETLSTLPLLENKYTNNLKPLNNLYVIASQAQIINDKEEIDAILDNGSIRVSTTLPDNYWSQRSELSGHTYSVNEVRNRFFSYSKDSAELRMNFENDLKKLLEELPMIIGRNSFELISELSNKLGDEINKEINKIKKEHLLRAEKELEVKKLKLEKPEKVEHLLREKHKVISGFSELRDASAFRLSQNISNILDVDSIGSVIEKHDFNNNKNDREMLLSLIGSTVEQEFKDIIEKENKKIKFSIEQFMSNLETDIFKGFTSLKVDSLSVKFDFKKAFVSGIAAAATYGGLTLYMATLGNLGGYILVTKAVGLLSTIGISVGGTAAAVTAVSAIGGPITLVIGLTIATSLIAFSLSGIGWKKSLSKRIIKLYEKEKVIGNYQQALNDFWKETELAFSLGVENIIDALNEAIRKEEALLHLNDKEYVQILIALNYFRDVAENLPNIYRIKTNV